MFGAYGVWYFILFLGVVIGVILSWYTAKYGDKSPFYKKALLTGNELHFYKLLLSSVGSSHVVLCQVAMGALLENEGSEGSKRYWQLRSRYSQKIVDYVICDAKTMSVKCLIELDDRTHIRSKDRERDALTASAGYKTLRFESKKKPTREELVKLLAPLL